MKCCVQSCKNYSDRSGEYTESISFHVFPRDEELKKEWIARINRPNWMPSKFTKICSSHFHERDLIETKKGHKSLRKGVLPYLRLGDPAARKLSEPSSNVSCDFNDSPEKNPLEEEISQLKYNAKQDRLKIRSLQMKLLRLKRKTQEPATNSDGRNVICPTCSTDIKLEDHAQEKENEMLVRVYEYFASECGELSRAQLRQRTALCAGVTQAAVLRALELNRPRHQTPEERSSPEQPPHKRQRKPDLQTFVEVDARFVKQEPTESDASGELRADDEAESLFVKTEPAESDVSGFSAEDPLDTEIEDIKPDVTDTVIQQTSQE